MLRPDNLPPPRHEFDTTGDPLEFERLARRFLGPEVVHVGPEPATVR
jgi:glutamate racemase